MIQEFKIRNFRSFKDEVCLNFEATKGSKVGGNQVVEMADGMKLLRLALVYGANASGKSNLLLAFDFLRYFWFKRKASMDDATETIPFLLDANTPSEPTEFSLKFYVDDVRYWYKVSLNREYVIEEKLSFYNKSVQPTLLFCRNYVEGQSVLKFNQSVIKVDSIVTSEITLKCLPNMSFFAARNMVNCSLPEIDKARDWMRKQTMPIIGPRTNMFGYAGSQMLKDSELKEYILDFVNRADFNITDVNVEQKSEPMPANIKKALLNDSDIPQEAKEDLKTNVTINTIDTNFVHTVHNERGVEKYTLPNTLQSEGTRRTFGIEAAIHEAVRVDKFLPIDEIESSLHPSLIEFILERFLKSPGRSQLLVTTHYDPLLNTVNDLLRKDSIWFTEKGEDGHSDLYSLTDFKGINKIRSFQKSYRNGVFGALPNIQI